MLRASFAALSPQERARVMAMYGSIIALHVIGFGIFAAFVVPAHYKGLGIGVSVLAYTLGLRHAFDADHISAIDNTTRKSINDRRGTGRPRPLAYGYFFSFGHSSIVVAIGAGIINRGEDKHRGFWGFLYNFNINTAGFVIVGMFVVTWVAAMLVWKCGEVEERWGGRLRPAEAEI